MTRWTRGAGLTALLIAVPTAAWAVGGESHSGPNWVELGSAMFNFCVYIALLVWLGRKPIAEFYDTRRSAVLASVEQAKARTEAAEARLAETMDQLASFDSERERILAEFHDLGERERDRIIEQARQDADKILRDAGSAASREVRRAKVDLEGRLVRAALGRAESELRGKMTGTTQAKLIDDGIETLAGLERPTAS